MSITFGPRLNALGQPIGVPASERGVENSFPIAPAALAKSLQPLKLIGLCSLDCPFSPKFFPVREFLLTAPLL